MQKIAIFCGSNMGNDPAYQRMAKALVQELYRRGMAVVYGGASVGLMGVVVQGMLELGGQVIGVYPKLLKDVEIIQEGLSEQYIVDSLSARKAMMNELCDGYIVLPGGAGSMDEFFDVFTMAQLGYHQKPYGFLDSAGYYQHLFNLLDHIVEQGFMKSSHVNTIIRTDDPTVLLDRMLNFEVPSEGKWL